MKIYLTKGNYGLDAVGGRLPNMKGEFDFDDYNAIAIVYAMGNLYIGDDMSNEAGDVYHSNIIRRNRIPQNKMSMCGGRIWYDRKVISFYPNYYHFPGSDELFLIITKLKDQLEEKIRNESAEWTPERLANEQKKLTAINGIESFTLVKSLQNIGEYFQNGLQKNAIVMMPVSEYEGGGYNGYEKYEDFKIRCPKNSIIDLVDGNFTPESGMPPKFDQMPGDSEYAKRRNWYIYNGMPDAVEESRKVKKLILTEEQVKHLLSEISSDEIDVRANEANTNPTDAQKEAGNYKMGHISVKGMQIAIENPKGSYRKYKDDNGDTGYNVMHHHYGYFNITKGKDGDAVDVFIGPEIDDFTNVYCVDQNNKEGEFDETKVMLGFLSKEEAKEAYLSNFSPDWKGFRAITGVSLKTFKKWLYRGRKQRQPFADYVEIQRKQLKEAVADPEKFQKFMQLVNEIESYIVNNLEGTGGKTSFIGTYGMKRVKNNYTFPWLVQEFGGGLASEPRKQDSYVCKAVARAIKNLRDKGFKLRYYQGV